MVKAYAAEIIPMSEVPGVEETLEQTDGDFVEVINVIRETIVEKDLNNIQ